MKTRYERRPGDEAAERGSPEASGLRLDDVFLSKSRRSPARGAKEKERSGQRSCTSVKILILDADDIASACPMEECIEEMARSFAQAEGKVQSPLRTRLAAPSGDILVMPSLARRRKAEGCVKLVSIFPQNRGRTPSVTAMVLLIDGENGEGKAVMDGGSLTAIRTGAVSGLSCRYLARKDSRSLGLIGAGGQAFQQVSGIVTELPGIERVRIFSRNPARSKALARKCSRALEVDASAEGTVDRCVEESDVLVTATTSTVPVFDGGKVEEGTHVIAIGAYRPDARELDSALVSNASVFVDSREAALEEAGDLLIPIGEGLLSRDSIKAELSELVLGRKRGRLSDSEVTLFKSVGLASEDNAAGWLAYRRAMRRGIGKWSEL
jgi:ornithine cyclodeaminase/alanine dehydrogenase-like protein (mu-crystallin family)